MLGVLVHGPGVEQVERADVERRGDAHPGPERHEPLREVEPRASVVEAGVDVGRADLDERLGALHRREGRDDPHGQRHPGALVSGEHPRLERGELQGRPRRSPHADPSPAQTDRR